MMKKEGVVETVLSEEEMAESVEAVSLVARRLAVESFGTGPLAVLPARLVGGEGGMFWRVPLSISLPGSKVPPEKTIIGELVFDTRLRLKKMPSRDDLEAGINALIEKPKF